MEDIELDENMKKPIKKQLFIRKNRLYCAHNDKELCAECMRSIKGTLCRVYAVHQRRYKRHLGLVQGTTWCAC